MNEMMKTLVTSDKVGVNEHIERPQCSSKVTHKDLVKTSKDRFQI